MQRDWIIYGKTGGVQIRANRGGTIHEIIDFLHDLELSYAALIDADIQLNAIGRRIDFFYRWEVPLDFLLRRGSFLLLDLDFLYRYKSDEELVNKIPPKYRLEISKVSINSPGVWEFLGALNPLEQIRRYLQERHDRIREMELRRYEKEKLELENELIRQEVIRRKIENIREAYRLHKKYGMPLEDLEEVLLINIAPRLIKLGEHQDRGLIE